MREIELAQNNAQFMFQTELITSSDDELLYIV